MKLLSASKNSTDRIESPTLKLFGSVIESHLDFQRAIMEIEYLGTLAGQRMQGDLQELTVAQLKRIEQNARVINQDLASSAQAAAASVEGVTKRQGLYGALETEE